MDSNLNSEVEQKATEKKPYQPPQVFNYGDVREITRAVGANGNMDAATGSVKTQP